MVTTLKTLERVCRHCGSTLIITNEEGKDYCLLCCRKYRDYRKAGRIGGLQTSLRYGRKYMKEIARRGGKASQLKTIEELRQQSAFEAQSVKEGGKLPNCLSELRELWRLQRSKYPINNENGGSP